MVELVGTKSSDQFNAVEYSSSAPPPSQVAATSEALVARMTDKCAAQVRKYFARVLREGADVLTVNNGTDFDGRGLNIFIMLRR